MSEIKVGENETLESALRRFKRKCARAGVLSEVRKREHYEKPSVKKRRNQKLLERESSNNDIFFWKKVQKCHQLKIDCKMIGKLL